MEMNSRNQQLELFPEETAELSELGESAMPEEKKQMPKPGDTVIDGTWYTKTLDHIVNFSNMRDAFRKVAQNGGAGGIDGMQSKELMHFFYEQYDDIRKALLDGTYAPAPVRRVEIPKDNGKTRMLGIPTLCDRGVQMAITKVLSLIYEPMFSETSYGFRPKRSAHDALRKCVEYANEGYLWVVDMDLEKYFDTVPQSKLLQMISRTVKDGRVISLLYRFLKAGAYTKEGLFERTEEGVPQGGPLSPLLGNIMLNECDKELERRGLRFVRYADDMMIFTKTQRSAERVMESIVRFIESKLHLKVNREKTVVRYITKDVKFLGHGFWNGGNGIQLRIHPKSIAKLKDSIREILDRNSGSSYDYVKSRLKAKIEGWMQYFRFARAKKIMQRLDEWMRHKIRCLILHNYRRPRSRYKLFRSLGAEHAEALSAANARQGYWALSGYYKVQLWMNNKVLLDRGYSSLSVVYRKVFTES